MPARARNVAIASLAAAAFVDSLYLKLYETGVVGHLWCPVTRGGCERVLRSPAGRTLGVSHTTAGLLGSAALAALAASQVVRPSRRRARLLQAMSLGASGASLYLAWLQKSKVGAWCSLCLAAEAANLAIAALAL